MSFEPGREIALKPGKIKEFEGYPRPSYPNFAAIWRFSPSRTAR